jgi:RNA polymerase sigma-70 factor (ECF subfamily)
MESSLRRVEFSTEDDGVDDDVLVQEAKRNRASFAPIYKRYVERVYHYVYRRVGNAAVAEDLTSQVFEDAILSLPKYRPQGRFAGWLFCLAYRRCTDYFRYPKTEAIIEEAILDPENDPTQPLISREINGQLERLLGELKEEELELLRLRFAAGLTYAEIAYVLGRKEGAVKMALSRLVQKLKSRWEAENE